jgi:hypothetical protein
MVKLHNKKVSGLKKDIDTYLSFFSKHQDKKVLLEIKDKYLTKCTNDDQCSCSDCRYLSSLHVPTISYVEKPMTEFTIDSIPTSDINQLSRKDALNLDAFFTKANSIIAKDSNMSKVMTEIYENPKKYPAAYKYFETYYLKNKDIEIFVSCKSLDYVQNKYPYSVNSHLYQLDNFTVNQVLENFRKSEYYDFATMSKERREKVNAIRDLGF